MIQELLVGLVGDSRNNMSIPIYSNATIIPSCNTTTIVNSSKNVGGNTTTTTTNTTTNNNNNNNNSEMNNSQNLRCPRCDSTNTKFCYYNNYNLTQPRHFCKACRRYWTKGGTLRNVPIGGGCRKNKNTLQNNSSYLSSNNVMAKAKTNLSTEMFVNENSLFLGNGLLDHPFQLPGPNPIVWGSLPHQVQNSHIMSLLRGSNSYSNPNPNLNTNPSQSPTSNVFSSLGLDSYGNGNGALSQLELFTRSNQHQLINGFTPDFVNNNGNNSNSNSNSNIMDLYQRLKTTSSPNNGYYSVNENPKSEFSDVKPLEGGDHYGGYGFMNHASNGISTWSDSSAVPINGAYP